MKKNIVWPSERHKKFGDHILDICRSNGIGVLLKGSIAKGIALHYSDIDVSLYGTVTKEIIEKILYGFEKPLMINASEKPPGLLIVAYSRGLALDMGINNNEGRNEKDGTIMLIPPSTPGKELPDSTKKYLRMIGRSDEYTKTAKLIHKGLLKYLNGKKDAAGEFINEIIEFTSIDIGDPKDLVEAFQTIVTKLIRKDDAMSEEFRWLIKEAAEKPGTLSRF
jgi:hypothetical protein